MLSPKKTMKLFDSSSINFNKNNIELSFPNSMNSLNNSENSQRNELDLIVKLMISETESYATNFELILYYYIRKNPKIKNDIIEKITTTLKNNGNMYYKSIIKCINILLDLLIDNFQIINLLNVTLPLLLSNLFQEENIKNIDSIHEICIFIGKLIKIGNTHISGLIEEIVDTIFLDIFNEKPDCNMYYAYIHLLSEIMKNSTMASYNSVLIKNGIENYTKLFTNCYKNKNIIIREMSGELTSNFIKMLMNRDNETKKSYVSILYFNILGQYDFNVKLNNYFPNNYFIVTGFLLNVKNIYLSYPLFFNDEPLYKDLVENLNKCQSCGKNEENIKIEYIKFIPDLYQMNKKIFKKIYLKDFLEYSNELLDRELSTLELKNNLLLVLSTMNFYEYDMINDLCSKSITNLIKKLLSDKNSPNDKVLKCLANLLNNKKGFLSQYIIQMIDVFTLLPKIFKTPLNNYKIDFLISLMNYYSYCSTENITVIILSLNVISLILCNEEFKLDNFLIFNESCKTSLISKKLQSIKQNLVKDINKYLSENSNKDKNNPKYCDMALNSLTLFSNIKNNLFYRDMLIFYNYNLLPLIKSFKNSINVKIINIILCDFVTIYKDDENQSEYILKNIIDSLLNIFVLGRDNFFKEELINIFENKKVIINVLLKENSYFFQKLLNILESPLISSSKKLLTRIFSILEKSDNNKGAYIRFISNYIETLIFEIYNCQSSIFEEDSINFLLHLTSYFKNIFTIEVTEKVINISILIIIARYEYKDILIVNALKIINELLTIENIENAKFKNSFDLLFFLCLKLLKECNINDYLSEVVLNLFYQIIKRQNIDIYSLNNFNFKNLVSLYSNKYNFSFNIKEFVEKLNNIKKKIENINILELLFNHLIKSENQNNSAIIMKILGLCGVTSPTELEKFYLIKNDSDDNSDINKIEYILEDGELQIKRFNREARKRVTLNYPCVEPSNTKAVITLMEILKNYTQKDLKIRIILNLQLLIQSIPSNQSYFIDIILPTIISIIPLYESKYQIVLFQDISLIITNFKEKGRIYLDDIVKLISNYFENTYLETIYKLLSQLFENYETEMSKYYHNLVPKFINIMKSDVKENISFIKLLILISKTIYIYPYIKLILSEIKTKFLSSNEMNLISTLLDLIKQIMTNFDTYIYFPSVISNFDLYYKNEDKLKLKNISNNDSNITICNKFLEILKIMNDKYRNSLIIFLPNIIKILNSNGLIEYGNIRQKLKKLINSGNNFIFMYSSNYIKRVSNSYCKINCHLGFNSFTNNKNENKKEIKAFNDKEFEEYYKSIQEMDIENTNMYRNKKPRGSFAKKKLNNVLVKTNRKYVNNEIVIKSFDNSNCRLEKDWNEWFKISSKSLFEQTPSYFIYITHLITEYYFSTNVDLSYYAFYSVYINNKDINKKKLSEYIYKATKNEKTPDEILLTILNLYEFMERKNINLPFLDYKHFGNIAYKCKAYAKVLYYKEKDFDDNKDIDNLIDLYYKLNVPENALGLINIIEKNENNRFNLEKEYDKKYIWYINMHDYSKALKIINEKLLYENDENKINYLKKYKNICLNGLCDWETILLEDELENENLLSLKEKDNAKKINTTSNKKNVKTDEKESGNNLEEKIQKLLLLLKCSADLGKWDKLSKYINDINRIFLENGGNEYLKLNKEKENIIQPNESNDFTKEQEKIKNIILYEINKDKIKDEQIDYIPYNDIININNNFQFLKYDDNLSDLMIYGIMINIIHNNYNIARKYMNDCSNLLINKVKVLIKESYNSGYNTLMKNQFLGQLEQYIDYKQNNSEDLEQIKKKFNYFNKKIIKKPEIYLKFLVVNSLMFPIEEEYINHIELANIYRKAGYFEQCENILNNLKVKMNLTNELDKSCLLNEKRINIELCYNKCLFEKGDINEAVEKGKYLIDLINDEELSPYDNLSDSIKSKIYGNYAIYRFNQIVTSKYKLKISRQKSENIKRNFYRHKTNYIVENNIFVSLFKKDKINKGMKQVKFNQKELAEKKIPNTERKNYSIKDYRFKFIKNNNEVNIINHYLTLSTQYNKTSYKYWHIYAMFNYKCYKYLLNEKKENNDELNEEENLKIIGYAYNAVNGFKHSIFIANKNKVKTLQDCLRFIDIFFESGSKSKELLSLIELVINEANIEIFVGIMPQLFCRFDIKDIKVLEILVKLLIKLFINYPDLIFFPLIIIKNSKGRKNKSIANLIMQSAFKKNEKLKELGKEYEEFINELNKCSILYHEECAETIENTAKLFLNKDYNGMINQLVNMHKKMNQPKESLYEINFYQSYGNELKEAEKYINKLVEEQNLNYLKEAWEIYQSIYKRIGENYSKFQTISLQYISSKLFNFRDSNIVMPGCFHSYYYKFYEKELKNDSDSKSNEYNLKTQFKPVIIQKIEKYLYVVNSKQHPRKISMIGSDSKEYLFLLKGHEDLRQDERVIQIFNLVNLILNKENISKQKNLLYITVYSVIPLSHKSGLIGWVHNCDTLNKLIKEQRAISNTIPNIEHNYLNKLNPRYESSKLLNKVETFLEILNNTKGEELKKIIWAKSKNCESWFFRTTNYSRSLAGMSILGYILGLGDRHLNNLLMSRKNGQIVHIDFGDCFEVAMKRDKFPEKVPFRLTRMLIKALGITEIEGMYRITCERMMNLLRKNKDSLIAILSALIHNPLISFRLMIPMIIKNQKYKKMINNFENDNKSNSVIDETMFKNDSTENHDFSLNVKKIIYKNNKNSESSIGLKDIKKDDESRENNGKDERQIIENEQRQIFNLYEENDEIDSEELHKIAEIVLNRINDKLNGLDFYLDHQLDEKEQVDKLIRQATLTENLAQSYLGWCPFW